MSHLKYTGIEGKALERRKFLTSAASGMALFSLNQALAFGGALTPKKQLTVQGVIDLILKEGHLEIQKDTVDTIKIGDPNEAVTGIVTTMFPTIAVIEEAVKRKANFIIAHEPSFYNHSDNAEWVPNNSVTRQKQELLNKHKLAIWRFHDYCHALKPDAVSYGVAKKANWLPYYKTGEVIMDIPSVSLQQLVQHLKTSLGISHLRVIGNPQQKCERVALLPGAWGGKMQVGTAETEKPDVLIVGEVSEWETAEYIRDSQSFGKKTSLIILGHAVSEEPGMEYFVEWLQPKVQNIKVSHVASGDPFRWM